MKSCNGCKYAEWHKTANGRLHPSGDGQCKFEFVMPPIPAAKYWIGGIPSPCGWRISRKEEHKEDCRCYEASE